MSSWPGGDEVPVHAPGPTAGGAQPAMRGADGPLAAELRGFGPLGILAILLILFTGNVSIVPMLNVPVGAILVLLWARLSHTPWREIGYVRPRSWFRTVALGIVFGVAFKIVMKMIVMPLLGADPVNHTYHFLAGNQAMLPVAIYAMLNAGFAEETVFRGFSFERLGRLIGNRGWAKVAIVMATSAWFGFAHLRDQGLAGAEQATIVGLTLGAIFALTGELPLLMITHAVFDLTALAIIYFDLETRVAHVIFK